MIDVLEELKNYDYIDVNNKTPIDSDEFSILSKNISKTYERLSKEQFKNNSNLEEIIGVLEESTVKDELINEIKLKMVNKDEYIKKLTLGLMNMYDVFEDMYLFSMKSGTEALKEALSFQREKNINVLSTFGISVIGIMNEEFDSKIHIVKEVKFDENFKLGNVIEILKSGYISNGEVVRKAEVIVNKGEQKENE